MLLGKRQRPPIRRTASMRVLSAEELMALQELPAGAAVGAGTPFTQKTEQKQEQQQRKTSNSAAAASVINSWLSPRGNKKSTNSGDFLTDATHFLRTCTLCKRRIDSGRDIYMYRGDSAYCSVECRQQHVNIDEKKEKCPMRSKNKESPSAGSDASPNGETVAAA